MNDIVEAQPRAGLTVWLKFKDGVEGVADFFHLAGKGVFRTWDERAFFEQVRVGPCGCLAWPNEIELDPDKIYMDLTGKTVAEIFPKLARQAVNA